jgi:hypothetical protein
MTRFQLIFRQDGTPDRSEFRYNDVDGEPHIDGRLIVDGETYSIRGVDWILSSDGDHHTNGDGLGGMRRFVCTLVVVPGPD